MNVTLRKQAGLKTIPGMSSEHTELGKKPRLRTLTFLQMAAAVRLRILPICVHNVRCCDCVRRSLYLYVFPYVSTCPLSMSCDGDVIL